MGHRGPGKIQIISSHVLQECELRCCCLRHYTGRMFPSLCRTHRLTDTCSRPSIRQRLGLKSFKDKPMKTSSSLWLATSQISSPTIRTSARSQPQMLNCTQGKPVYSSSKPLQRPPKTCVTFSLQLHENCLSSKLDRADFGRTRAEV